MYVCCRCGWGGVGIIPRPNIGGPTLTRRKKKKHSTHRAGQTSAIAAAAATAVTASSFRLKYVPTYTHTYLDHSPRRPFRVILEERHRVARPAHVRVGKKRLEYYI